MTATPDGSAGAPRSLGLWGFPLLYLAWAYLWWSPMLGSTTSVWSFPNLVFFLVGGASPLLAGVALAALTGGRERLRDLAWRLVDVRRISRRWWGILLVFWLAFDLAVAGAALALGVSDRPIDIAWQKLTEPGPLAFALLLSFVFPAVEEVGLRGYWLDELLARFGPARAGLVNGATWALWHAPFVAFPGYYASTSFQPELWWWLPSIVLETLLFVWVYVETERSLLAVLIFHAMMNFTGELLGLAPEIFPLMLVGNGLAAALLVARWRRRGPVLG